MSVEYPVVPFASQADWKAWLQQHVASDGVWVKMAKKVSGISSITYAQALEEALCFGWIDGQSKTIDATWYMQKFTPRRSKSTWSKVNVEKVNELAAAGRMQPGGLAAVQAAKADGRWERAYDSPTTITMPSDFKDALSRHSGAMEFYESLNKTNKFAFLYRIQAAKKPETRRARIEKFTLMLGKGEKFY
jgi:uncharacterized protein YdeI (YjbR/CyaY-like superfamily)